MLLKNGGSIEYERLSRVWGNQTRLSGKARSSERRHEFVTSTHETHLTATLWENFSLFDPALWLPQVCEVAGLEVPKGVTACQWSYEWEDGRGLCDVVICYRDESGNEHVIVVESKNLRAGPGEKDLNDAYYLHIAAVAGFESRRLLSCIHPAA